MKHIHKCEKCSSYTMKQECGCGARAVIPKPPKFSLDDKYAKYRRQVKKEGLVEKGLY